MSYLDIVSRDYGFFDAEAMKAKGLELSERYANADPFPHIAIDDFLPADVLDQCLKDFPATPDPESQSYDRAQERYKTSFNPDYLSPRVRSLFYSLNSRPFCQFLENMTGYKGLIPDPLYIGGGFHQTVNGGHLSVHADFNHHGPLNVERRINVLIYLNRDWKLEYGGALELWDTAMQGCVKRIAPEFGRCVVFSTNATSFHGHPDPINHPGNVPRRSIALYYYTATWDGRARGYDTIFKVRPKSEDRIDWRVKTDAFIDDWTPPILARNLKRVRYRLQKEKN